MWIMSRYGVAVFLLGVLGLTGAGQASAKSLFVDATARFAGDGSAHKPFRRITDALEKARAMRLESEERIVIHVAPGLYVGSYSAASLANDPGLEVLPLILNVPKLSLRGSTAVELDGGGFPTGTEGAHDAIIVADRALSLGQTLLLIAPTTDGMAGNDVHVSGFVLDPGISATSTSRGRAIIAERVSDFVIRANLVRHAFTGIQTRLASGVIESNLVAGNTANGIGIGGGSLVNPARVIVRANRASGNLEGLILGAIPNIYALQLGSNTLAVAPLQTMFDRASSYDRDNIPDTVGATIIGNDFSSNTSVGMRCFFSSPQSYSTHDETQPIRGEIDTIVESNIIIGNGDFGVVVDAGFPFRTTPRTLIGRFTGKFQNNTLSENGRGPVFFGFTRFLVSLGAQPRDSFKYLERSRIDVADDGVLDLFEFDNPPTDPFDGAVLENILTINGIPFVGTLLLAR